MTNTTQETPETENETFIKCLRKVTPQSEYSEEGDIIITAEEMYAISKIYHAARLKIEQSQPGKTLAECKDEVAKKYGSLNWDQLLRALNTHDADLFHDEAAELYAKQSHPKTVSDEEIEEEARMHLSNNKSSCPDDQTEGLVAWSFNKGARWMREKITGKQ